jgi:histidyl-tRNA synthetase
MIRINNRKILSGIAEYIGEGNRMTDITVAIDKIDKIGIDAVNAELTEKGISSTAIKKLKPVLEFKGDINKQLLKLEETLADSAIGNQGIKELKTFFTYLENADLSASVNFDITLARGLDYYTGAIIEVKSADISIGSICGGGRYDDLTGIFGLEGVSGVGISFGADRIYDVMNHLELFENVTSSPVEILILNFGREEIKYALEILQLLRRLDIKAELYPDTVKLKKQMSYADSKKIPYIIIAGEEEIRKNEITVKIMSSGEQKKMPLRNLESYILSVYL